MNFQESTTILNARTKNVLKPIVCTAYVAPRESVVFACYFVVQILLSFR